MSLAKQEKRLASETPVDGTLDTRRQTPEGDDQEWKKPRLTGYRSASEAHEAVRRIVKAREMRQSSVRPSKRRRQRRETAANMQDSSGENAAAKAAGAECPNAYHDSIPPGY